MRDHGTERPAAARSITRSAPARFTCAGCDQQLFVSKKKFESGTGWPSFNDPVAGRGRDHDRSQLRHGPHRGALQPLRQPPRPRVRRRPAADASALLHQRRRDELQAGVTRHRAVGRMSGSVIRHAFGQRQYPSVVLPGRRVAVGPESILPARGYGFPGSSLRTQVGFSRLGHKNADLG